MTSDTRWLLPDGIDELLPERAAAVETLRRALLDQCTSWGYRYVIPPLVEFTDSLLVGLGADLETLTCKFADRLSGKTMGVRADMTPQAARIDAHSLGEQGITRLCYAGSTLHSMPQSVMAGRSPIQLGAEIYGCEGLEADLEVVELLLALLDQCQLQSHHLPVILDIGHVGIFEALLADADISEEASAQVFDALQRKSTPDLAPVLATLPTDLANKLIALTELHGASDVLNRAREVLGSHPVVCAAINDVAAVVNAIECRHPEVAIYIDLAELRGFRYHTGLVFAAYLEGIGSAVAKGGRYDNVGSVFGRARPATGFACDLKALASAATGHGEQSGWISAPTIDDLNLQVQIAQLRHQGHIVVRALQGQHDPRCSQTLVLVDNNWQLQPL